MEPILFYCYSCAADRPTLGSPSRWTTEIWHPYDAQIAPSCGLSRLTSLVWLGFHHLRIFRNRQYAAVLLRESDGTCVHRTLLFPPYFRFAFMAHDDLQCGDIWTHPDYRGQGVAGAGLLIAIHHAWRPGRKIWYLAEETNPASCRLAIKAGFHLAARGRRTAPFGLKPLGQFVMTSEA